jgi:Protein of unknown function (DUF3551)
LPISISGIDTPVDRELDMKIISMTAIASVIALSIAALGATGAAKAGPIVPRGHACLQYDEGGTDCSFTSYAQCEATASGIAAECYAGVARDDEPWRRQSRSIRR